MLTRIRLGVTHVLLLALLGGSTCPLGYSDESPDVDRIPLARRILDGAEVQGGLIVHVGCGAGELTAVYVPHAQDEAMRDLTRGREDAVVAARKSKQRLNAFLLRNGLTFAGRTKWLIELKKAGQLPVTTESNK